MPTVDTLWRSPPIKLKQLRFHEFDHSGNWPTKVRNVSKVSSQTPFRREADLLSGMIPNTIGATLAIRVQGVFAFGERGAGKVAAALVTASVHRDAERVFQRAGSWCGRIATWSRRLTPVLDSWFCVCWQSKVPAVRDSKLVSRELWKLVRPVVRDAAWTSVSSGTARPFSMLVIDVVNWEICEHFCRPRFVVADHERFTVA